MAYPSRQMDERFLNRIPSVAGNVVQSSNPAVLRIQNQNINPPPLPPRNYRSSSSYGTGFGSYHQPYSMYGGSSMYGGYGGYGGLGGYGGMGYGYGGGYGMHRGGVYNGRSIDDPENSFIQLAEESSRPAFESIESIVRTFASVTMMLESTFHAMHTSFHAVLGVAENCNRLRQLSIQIAKYVSAFAMLKTIYWFYRRVLYTLGLIRHHPSTEAVWKAAEKSASHSLASSMTTPGPVNIIQSTWPIVTFFGLLFGGPYVIFKLMSSIRGETDDEKWDPRTSESDEAIVLFSHRAPNENELSIKTGEILRVPTPKYIKDNNCGWVMAMNQNNRVGLVPLNYIKRVTRKSLPSKNVDQGVKSFNNKPVVDNSLAEQVPKPMPNEEVIVNPDVPSCNNPNSTKTVGE